MDSLTQFTLGAVVSTACLGRKMGARKAAVLGGLLGTLPDLDVLLPFDNPVDAFVFHRGWTHSIFVHALAAPLIGELLLRFIATLKGSRARVWLAVFLCLSTHAMIDAITVYGTRLFWPFYPDPIGIGSLFIIDPLYTLPLLAILIWALIQGGWSARLRTGVMAALIFSTAYLCLSMVLQNHIENRAKNIFAREGLAPHSVFAIAGPLNTVVWKVIGQDDDRYHNLYLSMLDKGDQARIYTHPSRPDLSRCLEGTENFEKLKWFSRGYFRTALEDGRVVMSDLRMGLTPGYVFRFAIAEMEGETIKPTSPVAIQGRLTTIDQDLKWLGERFKGRPAIRQAERAGLDPMETSEPVRC